MVHERKKRSRRCVSSCSCVTLALALFPLNGKTEPKNDSGILDSLINVNNPLPLNGQALLDAASNQAKNKDEKTDKDKSSKIKLKDDANSTSTRGASKVD